ncbi:hypothetical protein AB8992_08075 [Yersinia enterocolitica]|uniref:hypothetical protein n=1 Tax=Yersinia enterocolitica TaxID=630 RepID=UPI003CFCDCAF
MLSKAELNLSTDALTVEQAVEHALAVYEQNDCNMFGRQHKQLAIWLTELLSLREQLAELKALEPVAEFRRPSKKHEPMVYWFGKQSFPVGTQLFTAAKPAEDKC